MGKPTGFLEYTRKEAFACAPKERIKNFHEFHLPLDIDERQRQGARCMNCGVPFCQSDIVLNGMRTGCPLNNLIPEWNDEIYAGSFQNALDRLLKTNNFPEFTGRVCPALCEKACLCGLHDAPVTIRDNELFVIENAFENHRMTPRPPKLRTSKRVAVIGSGPAGLTVADSLNRRGHNVDIYERDDNPGGLLMYGIPNMKLDKQVIFRRIRLMQAEGVRFILNTDIQSPDQLSKDYDAVILCCGARHPRDLKLAHRDCPDIHFAVDFLTSATKNYLASADIDVSKKFKYISARNKHVVIVGGGDTGNDCVATCIRQGAKSVTQLEMMPMPPLKRRADNPWPAWPKILKTDYGQEEAAALFGHDPRVYETTVKALKTNKNGHLKSLTTIRVAFQNGVPSEIADSEQTIKADMLIIAAGFTGCEEHLPSKLGVRLSPRSTVATQVHSFHTNIKNIFTAGDMHRGQSLVVWAIAEGRQCAREVDAYLMGYTNMT